MIKVAKLITLLSIMALGPILYAQKDTSGHYGYLITKGRDTLKGKIYNHHKHAHSYVHVKQLNTTHKDSTFYPDAVGFYTIGDKSYTSVMLPDPTEGDTIYQFAQILLSGPISVYETKIKTDFILPPKRAYLAEKLSTKEVVPFGKTVYIVPLIKDYEQLANEVAAYKYDNTLGAKKEVCQQYNEWVAKK